MPNTPKGPWRSPDTFQEGGGRWRGPDTFREGGGRWRNPARFVEGGGRWLPENRFKSGPWTWRPGDGDWWKSWQGGGNTSSPQPPGAPEPPLQLGSGPLPLPPNLFGAGSGGGSSAPRDPQGPGAASRQPIDEFTGYLLARILGGNWR